MSYHHPLLTALTYWDIINPHPTQCPSIVAEVILYGRVCHLKKTLMTEKQITHK